MKKVNVVFIFFIISFLLGGCQKKENNYEQEQNKHAYRYISGTVEEKSIDVQPADPITSREIEVVEVDNTDADAIISTDGETISPEDNIPETTETDEEIKPVEIPVLPVFSDEPAFSVAELTEMPFVIDHLNSFFEGKEYSFFDESQNVKSRYIYFAAHYVPESPKMPLIKLLGLK